MTIIRASDNSFLADLNVIAVTENCTSTELDAETYKHLISCASNGSNPVA